MINKEAMEAIIEEAKNRLIKVYDPLEIYLFGSYAWGQPDQDSDLDFAVIIDHSEEKSYKRPLRGYDVLMSMRIPNDILVYTKEEWTDRASNITSFAYKVKNQGKRLYAKA